MLNNALGKYHEYFYFIFRVLVGLLFFQHGAMKVLGWFGGTASAAWSLMWVVGLLEILAGLVIALGFFTRLAALGGVALMLIIYFKVHAPQGLAPIMNKGELALLYFAIFLMLLIHGAGKWGLERAMLKRETF
ncbi:MAG TPA: DoxX family protein [Candidatus Nanoarchaeia archaeon]|nr:DoxX family protein [Candidatus Nanoarchaeia archaeon]